MGARDELSGRRVGEFVLRERIGQGGFAAVYRCEQPLLGREAVVKVLHHRLRADEVVIQRFLREAQLASRLDHPYAAHVYAFGVEKEDGLLWIAMEMVHGTPLDRWLRERGPLPLDELVPFFERIAEVVQTAHERGIVHRDLKPSNLMVIERAGRLLPKLLDLGIAKLLAGEPARGAPSDRAPDPTASLSDADTLSADHRRVHAGSPELGLTVGVLGSPPYMAPEQWNGGAIGPAADLYALGVLAYEALAGRRPFSASRFEEYAELHGRAPAPPLGPGFAPALDRFFERALAKCPEDRPASALALAAALRAASGLGEDAGELPRLERGVRDAWIADAPQPLAEAVAALDAARNLHQARDGARELLRGLIRHLIAIALAARSQVRDDRDDPELAELLRAFRRRDLELGERVRLLRCLVRPFTERRAAHPVPALVELLDAVGGDDPLEASVRIEVEHDAHGGAEELLRERLARRVAELGRVLRATSFVLDHPLVVARGASVERWTGLVRRPRRPLASVRAHALAEDQPALVGRDGRVTVLLWPLVQVLAPAPGAEPELFVLDGCGRRGARLVAAPAGFERHDAAIWDWLGEHVLGSIEGDATAAGEAPPYLGLATFGTADAERFVGRERETDALVNRLRLGALQVVVGPSGTGKSSFVHAGVIPALERAWRALVMRPGEAPIAALAARLRGAGIAGGEIRALLEASPETAAARLAEATGERGLVVVVDQLEELFTLCHDDAERARFAAVLAHLSASAEAPLRVLCTVRDDFLMRVEALPAVGPRLSSSVFLLGNPSRDDLVRTVVEPARRAGYELSDPELAPEMADAVHGRPGALALLSFTASRLWELRDRRFRQLTRKAYEAMGGVGGALGRHAEEAFAALTADEQRVVREAFRRLVTAEGTRAQLAIAELAQALASDRAGTVLDKLIAGRLLVTTDGEDGPRIEIAHEALLAAWPRAQRWIREDAEGTRMRDQLASAARQWEARKRPQGLLWRDDALAELERWRRRPEVRGLTESETAFADASRAAAARSRRVRRSSLAAAFGVLAAMVVLLANLYLDGRRVAAARQRELAEQLEEHGRLALLAGRPGAAVRHLLAAVDNGAARDAALELMLGEALRAFDGQRGVLRGHDGVVYSIHPAPGSRLISAGGDGTARLWSPELGQQLLVRGGAPLRDAQVDPTGARILTVGEGGRFRLHAGDGRQIGELAGPAQPFELLHPSFRPDGARVATVHGAARTVRIWSAAGGELVCDLPVGIGAQRVVWRPDGAAFVVVGSGAELRDAGTGALVASLDGHTDAVIAAAFTPDGTRLATGSHDRTAILWDGGTGKLRRRLDGHGDAIEQVAFDPAGAYLGTASRDGSARIWDAATGRLHRTLDGHGAIVKVVAFGGGGSLAATGSEDGILRLWQLPEGRLRASIDGHAAAIHALAFIGDELVSASADGTLRRWSTAERGAAVIGPLSGEPFVIELARGARRVVVGGADGSVLVHDVGSARSAALAGHRGAVLAAALDDAGGAVTAAADGTVRFWRGAREEARIEVAGLSAAAIGPGAGRIVTGTERGSIVARDARTRAAAWSFEVGDAIARLVHAPRGDRLLAVTRAGVLHLFDALRGARYAVAPGHERLRTAAFGPRGELIATAGDRVRVYDLRGRLVHELRGHAGRVMSARFDALGERAVTSGVDGTVRLWSVASGAELRRFEGHRGFAVDAQLDARGLLWSVGNDGTLRAWDPGSGRLLSTFVHHRGDSYGMQIAADGATIVTAAARDVVVREPSLGRVDLDRARSLLAP